MARIREGFKKRQGKANLKAKWKARLKALGVATSLIVLILASLWWVGEGVSAVSDSAAKQALHLEGRRLLYQMQLRLREQAQEGASGNALVFDGSRLGDSPMKTSFFGAGFPENSSEPGGWWGELKYQELASKYCPDCGVKKDSFKLVAIGNIDEDPELEVWIYSSGEAEARQISSD